MKTKQTTQRMNTKGVFGLSSVQTFFAIILGVALLAYVIVIISGTLSANTNTIIPLVSNQANNYTLTNFTVAGNTIAGADSAASNTGFSSFTVLFLTNATGGQLIPSTNYTTGGDGTIFAVSNSPFLNGKVNVSFTYKDYSTAGANANNILTNTSGGVASFFGSVNPVYAILAVLVIILILVVLVRVVAGGKDGQSSSGPQL